MSNTLTDFETDLHRLLDQCRDELETELAVLDAIEAELAARIAASRRFARAFGHLAPPDGLASQPAQSLGANPFQRLADDLGAALAERRRLS